MSADALRLAMVTTFYPPYHFGGDGVAVQRLSRALVRRGHRVEVIHDVDAYRMLTGGAEPAPETDSDGVRVHSLRSRLGSLSCLATHQLGRPLLHGRRIRRLLARGFDVIHFHNVSLVGGPGILACGDAVKLYTAHEHWLVCPSHVLWRHDREVCTGRQCLRCVLHYRRPPQLWRYGSLMERQTRHVDRFVTPSRFCADKHHEFGFGHPLAVLPPFLPEAERTAAAERESGPGSPYFLFVGRLERIKGLHEVVPLFARGTGGSADWAGGAELWIAGAGSQEDELRALASGSPRVRFLGHQPHDALRRLYRDAVALLVPSIGYEVFPMVVLEAFREGTPIVARRLGPFPEIVAESGGGLLFETPQELAAALSRLEGERELRRRLGESGRRALASRWSEATAMRRYFELIADAARDRGRTALERRATRAGASGAAAPGDSSAR